MLTELVAQVNCDFIKAALVVTGSGKMLIDVLPLAVLLLQINENAKRKYKNVIRIIQIN